MTRTLAIIILAALLGGCHSDSSATIEKRGAARIDIFRECMALAAKLPRQSDDAVYKAIDSCGQQSYYMTNHITAQTHSPGSKP